MSGLAVRRSKDVHKETCPRVSQSLSRTRVVPGTGREVDLTELILRTFLCLTPSGKVF